MSCAKTRLLLPFFDTLLPDPCFENNVAERSFHALRFVRGAVYASLCAPCGAVGATSGDHFGAHVGNNRFGERARLIDDIARPRL